jgi:hypothetical protein
MAYTQTTIETVNPPALRSGQVFLSWETSASTGTWFQVYVNQCLAWYGQRNATWLPVPSGPCRIDVGSVDPGEQATSFASMLVAAPARRCQLEWTGGTFLGTDIAGFHIYGSHVPGVAVDFTSVLSDMTAYPTGISMDGFGMGSYGAGGLGNSASTYQWTSSALAAGNWTFAVRAYDQWGNEGNTQSVAVTVSSPPRAPAAFGNGRRLLYRLQAFGQSTFGGTGYGVPEAILSWNQSLSEGVEIV